MSRPNTMPLARGWPCVRRDLDQHGAGRSPAAVDKVEEDVSNAEAPNTAARKSPIPPSRESLNPCNPCNLWMLCAAHGQQRRAHEWSSSPAYNRRQTRIRSAVEAQMYLLPGKV